VRTAFVAAILMTLPLRAQPAITAVLEAGRPVDRALAGGESHAYEITLRGGECARLTLDQRGIDVTIRVLDAAGAVLADLDLDSRRNGQERVEIVSVEGGAYQVQVAARYPREPAGSYELRVDDVRIATARDRLLDEARRLHVSSDTARTAGKYGDAAAGFRRASELAEQALGTSDPYVAFLQTKLGSALRGKGDFDLSEQAFVRAIAIYDASLGRDHPQTANALALLGALAMARDDYPKAEASMREAIDILERTVGAEHPRVASVLADLADLHSYRGDLTRARSELERAFAIGERTLDPGDFAHIALVNDLAALYVGLKEYDLAEPLAARALDAIERRFGADNVRISNPLMSLAIVARERAQYVKALGYLQRAYTAREHALGPDHRETASLLIVIGNVHVARGDYERALDAYRRAHDVLETAAGPYHSLTMLTLVGMVRAYTAMGDIAHAIEHQSRADAILEKTIDFNLAIGSAKAKLTFAEFSFERTGRTITLGVTAPYDRAAAELAALVLLQRKGRVGDAMGSSLAALRDRLNDGDRRLLDRLNATTAELATLALQGRGSTPFPEYRQHLAALEEQRGSLEAEASDRSAEFRARTQPVSLAGVRALIPDDAALLEIAVYDRFNPRATTDLAAHGELRYVACVIRRDGDVRLIDLGAAKEIDALVARFREALHDPALDPAPFARALDQAVMAPVRPWLGNATRLLVSPDGALNLVPFEAFLDTDQRYLIERFAVTYLTTGRDLLRLQVARPSPGPPVVVADAIFGEPGGAAGAPSKKRAAGAPARRSVVTADSLATVYFAPLAATGYEARAIQSLFPDARLLTGAAATKAALLHVAAPSMLHIATHGFFLAPSEAVDNPLIRSGLALSGANFRGADGEPGILTALEASTLNLWGTQLVTLSACDTGVGEIRNGEGVYGLRRAFFLAGAETLVMSLWPVSDSVTRDMMGAYYRRLKEGLGRGDALREAQQAMMARAGRRHPFYWASFIQAGEWANLAGLRPSAVAASP
jgi:CHAT domain-containing protein